MIGSFEVYGIIKNDLLALGSEFRFSVFTDFTFVVCWYGYNLAYF